VLTADEAGHGRPQVVTDLANSAIKGRAAASSDWLHRRPQLLSISGLELQRCHEPLDGIAVGMRRAAFELLNPIDAEVCTFSEGLLRQTCEDAVLPQ
jgi:hypothetical protein